VGRRGYPWRAVDEGYFWGRECEADGFFLGRVKVGKVKGEVVRGRGGDR
jgi:hypothetical protein